MVVVSKFGWGKQRKYSDGHARHADGRIKTTAVKVETGAKVVNMKELLMEFMVLVESKNSHGRVKLLDKLTALGLKNSKVYKDIANGPTSVGKNVLKGIVLYALIERLK